MERLGKWRDKGTGINPFIRREERYYGLLLIGILRLPLYVFFSGLFYLTGNYYVGRLLLLIAGVKHIESNEAFISEDIIRPYSEGKLSSKPRHHKGDLIVCNSVCWLDQIILRLLFPGGTFVFPEGCPTNNRGVLKFQRDCCFEGLSANSRVRLIGFKYDPVPPPSWLNFANTGVIVKTLSPEAIWQAPNFPSPADPEVFALHCQQKIASLVHLKPLQMDLNDYLDFEGSHHQRR